MNPLETHEFQDAVLSLALARTVWFLQVQDIERLGCIRWVFQGDEELLMSL